MDNFFVGTHHNFPRQSCFHNHSNHCIYHSQKYIYLFPYISMYLLGKLKMKKWQITDLTKWNTLSRFTFFSCQVNRIQQVVRFGSNHGFNSQSCLEQNYYSNQSYKAVKLQIHATYIGNEFFFKDNKLGILLWVHDLLKCWYIKVYLWTPCILRCFYLTLCLTFLKFFC